MVSRENRILLVPTISFKYLNKDSVHACVHTHTHTQRDISNMLQTKPFPACMTFQYI